MAKKRGICWRKDCEKKHVARISVQFIRENTRDETLTAKFCAEHFLDSWHNPQGGFKVFIDSFLEEVKK